MNPEDIFTHYKNELWMKVKLTDNHKYIKKHGMANVCLSTILEYKKIMYGGFLENRSIFFDKRFNPKTPIHVGVDFWVPELTLVTSPVSGKILYQGNSDNQNGGWGYRIDILSDNKVYIFGHLTPKVKFHLDEVKAGSIFYLGAIGRRNENGGWHPHLHLQCVKYEYYLTFDNPRDIDAYAPNDTEVLKNFINPLTS